MRNSITHTAVFPAVLLLSHFAFVPKGFETNTWNNMKAKVIPSAHALLTAPDYTTPR